ncbi:MAG: low molecular weight protein-tyrosine-phosphatase [Gammaproteobacteria bacterium]
MGNKDPVKVLFVCMGNICRSPTAHGVFQALVDEQGLNSQILVDSAGTHSYHIGSPPDPRSLSAAQSRGVDLSGLRARQFQSNDYNHFDFLIAMDQSNRSHMAALNPGKGQAKLVLMLEYSKSYKQREVPDPYYGDDGFDQVFDMIADASAGLLEHIRQQYSLR